MNDFRPAVGMKVSILEIGFDLNVAGMAGAKTCINLSIGCCDARHVVGVGMQWIAAIKGIFHQVVDTISIGVCIWLVVR